MKVIDLFAGLGGSSLGARMAGAEVLWAANHSQEAVKFHSLNHPQTIHVCQDLHQADWSLIPRMDGILASPSCQGFTKARGKERACHDKYRSTAWAVVSCTEYHRPEFVIVENVPEFINWILFPAWKSAMQALGYAISVNMFDFADVGGPQNRVRFFGVFTRSKSPITIKLPQRPAVQANQIIDWSAGRWSLVYKPKRSPNTLTRYEHGRKNFGRRFVFPYYGMTRTARSIHRPIGTITTVDRWAVVDGDRMRMFSTAECRRAMGFPDDYQVPSDHRLAVKMLGNAVPPPLEAAVIGALN